MICARVTYFRLIIYNIDALRGKDGCQKDVFVIFLASVSTQIRNGLSRHKAHLG